MARNRQLVDNLVSEVRSLMGERNTDGAISDVEDVLPALNAGLVNASSILARAYPDNLIGNTLQSMSASTNTYGLPEDILENKVLKIEIAIQRGGSGSGIFQEITRVKATELSRYDLVQAVSIPSVWALTGDGIVVAPTQNSSFPIRIWYCKTPPALAVNWGRITQVNEISTSVRVDAINEEISTDVTSLDSYVSIIDGQTGKVKGVLQVSSTVDGTLPLITFRTSRAPSEIQSIDSQAVLVSLVGLGVEAGDYLCAAPNTCICTLREPVSSYITRYAAITLNEPLGNDNQVLLKLESDFEKNVSKQWIGQENTARIGVRNGAWGGSSNRRRIRWPYNS
jgi:hypothetical protein